MRVRCGLLGCESKLSKFWTRLGVSRNQEMYHVGEKKPPTCWKVLVPLDGVGKLSPEKVGVKGFGFWVSGLGFRVLGLGFGISGLGLRVLGFGFRI